MGFLINTSLATAFVAGMAALFAPCCITVLLPTYLASIFRQKRKVFLMTFLFFLGIMIVFLPLGLGFGVIGKYISQFHDQIFFLGSLFMIFLGASILYGSHFSLPFSFQSASGPRGRNAASIFILGIFSGLATTCCAPVLAGVLALSVLPGSIFWGGTYALVYVLGMTLPLFAIALFMDKTDIAGKLKILNKPVKYRLMGKEVSVSLAGFFSGLMFSALGILILVLLLSGNLKMESHYQAVVNIYSAKLLGSTSRILAKIPFYVFPLFFFALVFTIVKLAISRKSKNEDDEKSSHSHRENIKNINN